MARTSLLDVVEAIYRDEKSDRVWLEGILVAARPVLDRGLGLVGFPFAASATGIHVGWVKVLATPAGVGPRLIKEVMATAREDAEVAEVYRSAPCATGSEQGLTDKYGFGMLRARGVHDCFAMTAVDTVGGGVFFGSLLPRVTRIEASSRARLSRIAAHLGVGQRYRRIATSTRRPDAVLQPGGKLLHAEGDATTPDARTSLRQAAVALDRARGRQRRTDPDGALDAWKGLVSARWSLVDRFESDGKRYVVACENEPCAPPLSSLSKRERQIVGYVALGHTSKLIAYELGISHSTVRVLLSRAMQRLDVKSRQALVAAFLASQPDTTEDRPGTSQD